MPVEELQSQLQTSSKNSESSKKRIRNIEWITKLPREGLAYRDNVSQIYITQTPANEYVLLQYPGKESARDDDKKRPWDFFPRVEKNNKYSDDLDFQAIWDILYNGLQVLIRDNQEWAAILATMFYRMAFMNDHVLIDNSPKTNIRKLSYINGQEIVKSNCIEEIQPYYHYSPNKNIIDSISAIVPLWGSMSFEAFLHYNDLLAWNEDCKYTYRMLNANLSDWIRNIGRINTLLTHLNIIGYVSGKIKFSEICIKFARGKGVAPATREDILKICSGYVTK